ncbi:MAG: hypothetical protein KZQ83_07780 [gamma proteobacterium symbiont of Taylorina sp.]|nr:hypothetical protein [gamma proteobacterium symbiont of Taylorina sp.]
MNIIKTLSVAVLISSAIAIVGSAYASQNKSGRGSPGSPVIYVTSQGLYYDSIALTDLPQRGEFQELIPGMNGLETEFGPGNVGHLGGRWWIDLNMDGEMDSGDKYFLCPLLGPGRESL